MFSSRIFPTSVTRSWPWLGLLLAVAPTGNDDRTTILSRRLPLKPSKTISFETNEGTSVSLDISPDGKTIVFDLLGDIYSIPANGGKATQLTRGMAWDAFPSWSPDGKQIAFLSDGTGSDNAWVMDRDGKNLRPLSWEYRWERLDAPAWNSEGTAISVAGNEYYLAGGRQPLGKVIQQATRPGLGGGNFIRYSPDGRYIYYHNDSDGVMRYDRQSGAVEQLAKPPVKMGQPVVSPDGRWLVYVTTCGLSTYSSDMASCHGDPENSLRVLDLESGQDQWLKRGLAKWFTSWQTRYTITPDSRAVIIWYGGKIHKIDIASKQDEVIPFTAHVKVDVAPTLRIGSRLTTDSLDVRSFRSVTVSPDGRSVAFSTLMKIYTAPVAGGTPRPLVDQPMGQYQPAYSPDGRWIAFVTWHDTKGGQVWKVSPDGRTAEQLTTVASYYQRPVWSPDGKTIAVTKGEPPQNGWGGDPGQILLLSADRSGPPVALGASAPSWSELVFTADGKHLIYAERGAINRISTDPDRPDKRIIATIDDGDAPRRVAAPSPDGKYFAYVTFENLYLTPLAKSPTPLELADTSNALPAVQLSTDGAWDAHWSQDGKTLTWTSYGGVVYRIDADRAMAAAIDSAAARNAPGAATRGRSKVLDADPIAKLSLKVARYQPKGVIAFRGARIITMKGDEVIERGTIVIRDGRVAAIGAEGSVAIPRGATVHDVSGKTIIPGFIDMHAHLTGPADIHRPNHWEYLASLAYGITTAREVSSNNDNHAYYELDQAGLMTGSRYLGAGRALTNDRYDIQSLEDAREIVQAQKGLGQNDLKFHSLFTRLQQQWIVIACREAGMNLVGHPTDINFRERMDLSTVLDGYSSWEHHGNSGYFYADVQRLMAEQEVVYVPTTGVMIFGLDTYRSLEYPNLANEIRKRRFTPYGSFVRGTRSGSFYRTIDDNPLHDFAKNLADLRKTGTLVVVGSHGDDDGMEFHYDLWTLHDGGLSPMETLQSGTLVAAKGLGMAEDIGSLEVGKMGDLLVLDGNPLDDIRNSRKISLVLRNGELFDAMTLKTLWPVAKPAPAWQYRDFGPPDMQSK